MIERPNPKCGECLLFDESAKTRALTAFAYQRLHLIDMNSIIRTAAAEGQEVSAVFGVIDKLQTLAQCGGYIGERSCDRFLGELNLSTARCESWAEFRSRCSFGSN